MSCWLSKRLQMFADLTPRPLEPIAHICVVLVAAHEVLHSYLLYPSRYLLYRNTLYGAYLSPTLSNSALPLTQTRYAQTGMEESIAKTTSTNVRRRRTPALEGTRKGHSVWTTTLHRSSNVVVSLDIMPFSPLLATSRTT